MAMGFVLPALVPVQHTCSSRKSSNYFCCSTSSLCSICWLRQLLRNTHLVCFEHSSSMKQDVYTLFSIVN
jgi:hypothetical protein